MNIELKRILTVGQTNGQRTLSAVLHFLRRHWPLVIPFVLSFSVFHAWLKPGLLLGADWVRRVPDEMYWYWPWPHVWNPAQQMGESNAMYLSSFPIFSLMGLASHLGVSWNVIERIFFFWPYLAISAISPYAFAFRLTRSPYGAAVAASFFTVNTWIIMATERGAIPSIFAAALVPLFLVLVIRFIETPSPRCGLGLGLFLTMILIFDLRYVYIGLFFGCVLAAEQLVRDRSLLRLRRALPGIAVAMATALITNLFWIIPQFAEFSSAGAGYGSVSDYILNSHYMTPAHAVSAFAVFYHWVASNNPFAPAAPDWYFFLIPVAVFISLAAVWRRKWVFSLAVGAAVSVLLCSGPSFPLQSVNVWIFTHVPGMSLFRDVTKWMSLLEITYGTIIAYAVARAAAWLRLKTSHRGRLALVALPVAFVAAYALLMNDSYNPMRYRVFATYHMHKDVVALENFLENQPGYYRTLVFPRDIEPLRAVMGHPYVEGLQFENSQPTDGFRYLNPEWDSLYGLFSAPFAADLLRSINVKYVVVPYDYDKVIYEAAISNWSYFDALHYIATRPWLKFVKRIGKQSIFELRQPMLARAYIAPTPFVLNGSGFTLTGLAGSKLVNPRMAALLLDQPLHGIRKRVPNYVSGAWAIDTNLFSQKQAARFIRRADRLQREAGKGAFSYYAAATSTAANASHIYDGDDPIMLQTALSVPHSGVAHVQAEVMDVGLMNRRLLRSRSFTQRAQAVTFDNRASAVDFNGELTVHKVAHNRYVVDSVNPAEFVGEIVLELPHGSAQSGTVMSLNGRSWHVSGTSIRLEHALLHFGRNELTVAAPENARVSLPPACGLFNEKLAEGTQRFVGKRLASNLHISLAERPFVAFRYQPLPKQSRPALVFTLRSRENGSYWYYVRSLNPRYGADDVQLESPLLNAQNQDWERLLAAHAGDPKWLFKHRLSDEPDGIGSYDLTSIDFVVENRSSRMSAADAAHVLQPSLLDIRETPATPSLGTADSRQTPRLRNLKLPPDVTANGYVLANRLDTGGLYRRVFTPRSQNPRLSIRSYARPGQSGVLQFNFFQDKWHAIRLLLQVKGRAVASQTIEPFEDSAPFGPGGIHPFDGANVPWITGTPHCLPRDCATGAGHVQTNGTWRTVHVDLSNWNGNAADEPASVTLTYIPLKDNPGHSLRVALTDGQRLPLGPSGDMPALLVDGKPVAYGTRRDLPESSMRVVQGTVTLHRGTHSVETYPAYPIRTVSAVLSQGRMKTFRSATLKNARTVIPEEVTGDIDSHGGLLVFTQQYDPEWKLALVPRSLHLTGNVLVDSLHLQRYILPSSNHYVVNDVLNAWWVPAGRYHVIFICELQAIIVGAAIIWISASVLWVAGVLLATRGLRTKGAS